MAVTGTSESDHWNGWAITFGSKVYLHLMYFSVRTWSKQTFFLQLMCSIFLLSCGQWTKSSQIVHQLLQTCSVSRHVFWRFYKIQEGLTVIKTFVEVKRLELTPNWPFKAQWSENDEDIKAVSGVYIWKARIIISMHSSFVSFIQTSASVISTKTIQTFNGWC